MCQNRGARRQHPGQSSNVEGNMETRTAPVISLGEWIITLIVLAIPLIGLIMMLVWAFSSSTNPSKQNFCRASLLFAVIAIVLFLLFGGLAILGAMNGVPTT
jgi:phosphoglycerol transferase MdoB-like AlkP superfamily enzyme